MRKRAKRQHNGFKSVTCNDCGDTVTKRKTLGVVVEKESKDEKGRKKTDRIHVRVCRTHFPADQQTQAMNAGYVFVKASPKKKTYARAG